MKNLDRFYSQKELVAVPSQLDSDLEWSRFLALTTLDLIGRHGSLAWSNIHMTVIGRSTSQVCESGIWDLGSQISFLRLYRVLVSRDAFQYMSRSLMPWSFGGLNFRCRIQVRRFYQNESVNAERGSSLLQTPFTFSDSSVL
jgi:hypothetical protein